jgi:nucleoid-associated protein YgaU
MIVLRHLRPLAWLTIEAAALVALTRLGSQAPFAIPAAGAGRWLRTAPPADVLVVSLRWIALAGAWWMLATTALYAGASMTRLAGAVRAVRWAALPAVRRAVDAAFAASLVAGSVLAPGAADATAGATPTTTAGVRDGHARGVASLPAAPAPVPKPAPIPMVASVVVVAGDNLWELSARHLAAATGRARPDVGDGEIAPYWVAVCEQNRGALASRDPDLILPGEVVTFPPLS